MELWLVGMAHLGYVWLRSRINGALTALPAQEERLWIADPKAINHILRNSGTVYRKGDSMRELTALVLDRGLSWADGKAFSKSIYPDILTVTGDVHKRQRRAMTPAFGLVETKGLLPYIAQSATKVRLCVMPVQDCDRSTLHAAGRQMARVDCRRGFWRIFSRGRAFVVQQSDA